MSERQSLPVPPKITAVGLLWVPDHARPEAFGMLVPLRLVARHAVRLLVFGKGQR